MPAREKYIKENRERLYKLWLVRSCFYGSFLFLIQSGLDYFATPENFRIFFAYRAFIALLLAAIGFVAKETGSWGITFHKWLGVCAVTASAGTIEIMILKFGGHNSPYAAGQILLGICILGFIPAWISLHVLFACIIYASYVVPIFLIDHIDNAAVFISANGLLLASLMSAMILRSQSERVLETEWSLQYDLLQSEQKYRDLFEDAVDPIFVVDQDLRYVDANRKATELTGFTKEELKRRTIMDMIPPGQATRSGAEFEKLRHRGAYEKFEGKMITKDGRTIDIEVSSSAVFRDGKIVGSHDIVREITDRKRINDELLRSNEELDQHARTRLNEMTQEMEREITERRKAERKIGEQLDRQRALTAVESAIASSLDLSLTLNVFIEQVMSQLRTDAAAVLLYDPEHQELTFAAERGFRTNRIKKVTVRAGQSLAGRVIALRQNIIIPDFEREDNRYPMPEGYSFKNGFLAREEGFRSYVGVPLLVKGEVKGIIEIFHRHSFDPDGEWREFLEALSRQAAVAIDNASLYEQLQRSHEEIIYAYDMTIEGWSRALDIRDNETFGHSQRVAALTIKIAEILGISGKDLVNVRRGALLHDIGKLGVPDSILLKPGKLTIEEMDVMKRHPTIAYDILSPIPFLREALDIPHLHHEKWDGSGYPNGMLGQNIPVPSRIFAVIDVWDALRSNRPYRSAWNEEKVINHLKMERGRHFDPEIVDVFLGKILPGANL